MTGISERSPYTYEQLETIPRKSNIRKLAETQKQFGSKDTKEAQEVLGRVSSLFAGGNLDEDKVNFFAAKLLLDDNEVLEIYPNTLSLNLHNGFCTGCITGLQIQFASRKRKTSRFHVHPKI